jgi:hypothetical protein
LGYRYLEWIWLSVVLADCHRERITNLFEKNFVKQCLTGNIVLADLCYKLDYTKTSSCCNLILTDSHEGHTNSSFIAQASFSLVLD